MERVSGNQNSRRRRLALIAGVGLFLVLLIGVIIWLSTPLIAKKMLQKQLSRVEDKTGVTAQLTSVETQGLRTLFIHNLELSHPDSPDLLGSIQSIQVDVDPWKSLRGRPVATGVHIKGAHLNLHRRADGMSLLDDLRPQRQPENNPFDPTDEDSPESSESRPFQAHVDRALRYFGGSYPDLIVDDLSLTFTSDAHPWPLDELATDRFTLTAGSDTSPFEALFTVQAQPNSALQLPKEITISGALNPRAHRSTIQVELEPPLRVADLPRLPFLEASIAGFSISDDYTLHISSPRLSTRFGDEPTPLISADRAQAQLRGWERNLYDLSLIGVEVDALRVFLNYHEEGASNISELLAIIRRSAAKDVQNRAKNIARALSERQKADDGLNAEDTPEPPSADDTNSTLSRLPIKEWLADYLPETTTFRDLRLVVHDPRRHENLTSQAHNFEVLGELITLTHRPVSGILEGALKLQVQTEEQASNTDIRLSIPYRRGDWNAKIDIDRLQLAQFSQLAGPRLARYLQGGEITASLDITNDGGAEQATRFDGLFAIKELRLTHHSVAEDPIELDSASLQARGFYDPSMLIPAPTLIEVDLPSPTDAPSLEELTPDDEANPDAEKPPPPTKGAVVFESARATLGDVEATFGLNIYGIEPGRLPTRAAFKIDLAPTPLPALIQAVPAAIQGPLNGMQMLGTLQWNFHLEVPLYKARNMRWETEVELSEDFEVLHLPPQVNVFKLFDAFEHTIYDEWKTTQYNREREFFYERSIDIPPMHPTPATWLVENTPLTLEEIDEIRRDRDWPQVPSWTPDSPFERELLESPEYWFTDHATSQAAPRPWRDPAPTTTARHFWHRWAAMGSTQNEDEEDEILRYEEPEPIPYYITEVTVDPDRYGPYVYVPLHHISPYLPRAIMTTEDTSFFTHAGFNFFAIRHSVEANIERGRFHRGASTISMQLAKNLFLNRQRVISRKLQEVVLVWLMESVAQVPKERMMELYLNIIEYGPGIFGVHEAAMHYFGKRPDELTIAEVAWLVSIVPSPKRHHAYYDRGEIPPFWLRRMGRYIRAMHRRERITEEEMEAALEEIPQFYFPEDGQALLRVYAEQEHPETTTAHPLADDPPQENNPTLIFD